MFWRLMLPTELRERAGMTIGAQQANVPSTQTRVVVFVHVHYLEIWQEITQALADRMDVDFWLVVTSSLTAELPAPNTPRLRSMIKLLVENRGRDILPFLTALEKAGDFDIGIKLHTKKSPQRSDGGAWRVELLDKLLPRQGVGAFLENLSADRRIGFVAPDGFSLSVAPWIFVNRPPMDRAMAALGHVLQESDFENAFFAAGSMFWFRRAALAELATPVIRSLFEREDGQLDGTIAHGMERLFPVEAKRQNFVSTAMSCVDVDSPRLSHAEIVAAARAAADRPNIYFPAPGVSAGAPSVVPEPVVPAIGFNQHLRRLCPSWLRALIRHLRR